MGLAEIPDAGRRSIVRAALRHPMCREIGISSTADRKGPSIRSSRRA